LFVIVNFVNLLISDDVSIHVILSIHLSVKQILDNIWIQFGSSSSRNS